MAKLHLPIGARKDPPARGDDRTYAESEKRGESLAELNPNNPIFQEKPPCECWEVLGGDAERCLLHDAPAAVRPSLHPAEPTEEETP